MSAKTSPRRAARVTARRVERAVPEIFASQVAYGVRVTGKSVTVEIYR